MPETYVSNARNIFAFVLLGSEHCYEFLLLYILSCRLVVDVILGHVFIIYFLLGQLSVDTLQFLLFLHIQQLNKVSLRTSLIGEEWPSPKHRSQSPDLTEKSSCHNKVLFKLWSLSLKGTIFEGDILPSLKITLNNLYKPEIFWLVLLCFLLFFLFIKQNQHVQS